MKKLIIWLLAICACSADTNLWINGKFFSVELANSESASVFSERMPMIAKLQELSSSGKFFYVPINLPSKPIRLSKVTSGDILLYKNRYIMIYADTFRPTHEYTKIGRIVDINGLRKALSAKSTIVKFAR